MKHTIVRILVGVVLCSLVSSIVLSAIGLMLGWTTSTQFSNGLFWAAAVLVLIGFVSLLGYKQRATNLVPIHMDPADRAKLWATDAFRGEIVMAVFGMSGLLLFGLSILVLRLF
jgi:hypothetical protein